MKKSFMTRVLAVSLSAAMAFSMSSASNLMTASAASTVNLKTTFKTLKVNQTYKLTLKNNTLGWKITKVTTSNKKICTVYNKKASSVMLKGKGVGRAKIKVKVKTTKRKYPKNIKYMTCTANVKAADNTDKPVADALSATAMVLSKGQVRIQFNKAVDDASDASAFSVSGGVTVTKAEQAEDKMSTVITMDGAKSGETYELTIAGIKVNGEKQADIKVPFTTPKDDGVVTGYELKVTPADNIVKCDGQHQTRVTFELLTKEGQAVTDKNVQIEFSASIGTFAGNRVTLDGGKATVQYNAPQLNVGATAGIHATVVEATNKDLIGTVGTGSITLSPNPDNLTSEAAIITSAAAGTADRVIAYFDKEVKPSDFMTDGRPDKTKFDCKIRSRVDNAFANDGSGNSHNVIAILPVAEEKNALEFLVDAPMTDNSNISVTFKDKRKTSSTTIDTTNTVYFRLADARQPSALNVETTGTKTIKVTFSEAVAPQAPGATNGAYSAWNINNYLIDGRSLADWGITQANSSRDGETKSGSGAELDKKSSKSVDNSELFNVADGKVVLKAYSVNSEGVGTDNRAVVEITVGSGHPLTAGSHQLTVKNVGDWASATDGARNSVSSQIFPFTIEDNAEKPSFKVTVQSPEQYKLDFNSAFKIAERGDKFTTDDSSAVNGASVLKLQEYVNGTWTDITTGENRGQNPIRVTKAGEKEYFVEVKRDWSQVYDQEGTRTSYYSKQLRLHVDAGKLVNVNNNLKNDAIDINLNADDANVTDGNKMKEQDVTSPQIVSIKRATSNGQPVESWNVELSEPVKISGEANKEGLTPSQRQKSGINPGKDDEVRNEGVPVPYAEFISVADPTVRVEGIIEDDFFIDADDKTINVAPERSLYGGDWRLVVGSISDDYGTVLATSEQTITIDTVTTSTDFQIVWAAVADRLNYETAHIGNIQARHDVAGVNPANEGRFVFVKFSKPVDQATALNQNNYTLNNEPLPHGSYIHANIKNYDDHDNLLDSVTIELPASANLYQNYTVNSQHSVLSVTGVVAAGTGEALSNGGMNTMPFNIGESAGANNYGAGDDAKIDATVINTKYDAVWGNDASEQVGRELPQIKDYYEALREALDNPKYRKVIITQPIFNTGVTATDDAAKEVFGRNCVLKINRAVNIELAGGVAINGNVEVNTSDVVGKMTIKGGTINGNVTESTGRNNAALTVNAGSVKDFVLDGVNVTRGANDYAIILNNVWTDSFVPTNGSNIDGNIYVNDTDGFGMYIDKDIDGTGIVPINWTGNLEVNSNGVINLKGNFNGRRVIVKQGATVNLGTVYVKADGSIVPVDAIQMAGAYITVEGPEALIKLTEATKLTDITDPNLGKATIEATAKNVKIYVQDGWNDLANGTLVDYRADKGGNILATDEYGRELPASSDHTKVETDTVKVDGVQKIFQDIDVIDGLGSGDISFGGVEAPAVNREGKYTYEYNYTDIVSGSAFSIDMDSEREYCKNQVVEIAENEGILKADGTAITASDIAVTFKLSNGAKLLRIRGGKIEEVSNINSVTGTDTISVTLTYGDYSFTKYIKIVKK